MFAALPSKKALQVQPGRDIVERGSSARDAGVVLSSAGKYRRSRKRWSGEIGGGEESLRYPALITISEPIPGRQTAIHGILYEPCARTR